MTLVIVLSVTVFYARVARQDDSEAYIHISELEIAMLQCRRAEKNFLMRHDQVSKDNFNQGIQALRKNEANLRSVTQDRAIVALLDDISTEITIYENAFQDIKGLYDSAAFGPVHDPALSKITDEVTLTAEPIVTPSSVDTTRSLVESARNLEYYIQLCPRSFPGLALTLNLRRWEKNFQRRYDKLRSGTDVAAIFYRRKASQEISKLRALIDGEDFKAKGALSTSQLKLALRQYELNFNQLVANQDAFHIKKKEMIKAARVIENNIQIIKKVLTPGSSQIYGLISEIEIAMLQCRRAEKNFLMRHDQVSKDNFNQGIQALRKNEANLRSVTQDRAIVALLDDISTEITIYENAFQDIKGLYDSAAFGPVHDPALSKITDEVTLTAEPIVTPSSVDTTRSLIEAARNLEYFINISPENLTPLISILQARRWEKNFQKRYDRLTGAVDSKSIFYIRKIKQEISKIRDWFEPDTKVRSRTLSAQLRSALERYEHNLAQLSRNLDAFYIKKKEMLRSARGLDRAIQMIKGKLFGTIAETEIDGIYYLSPKLPIHGQAQGNYHDVGSLVFNPPSSYGYRHCKNWMQFHFDRDGYYTKDNLISSIYFHIWIRTVNNSIDVGHEKDGKYSGGRGGMDDFISVEYDDSKGYSTRNGCSLITGKMETDYFIRGEDIYKFAIKLSRHSGYPSLVMEPNQYSFIIINPPCDNILKSTDSDNDGLNDYEEMFSYYTNPYDYDTDNDGFSDRTEVMKGTSPNSNDFYSGGVIAGVSDTPHIEHYKDIEADWIVDKEERYVNTRFTLHGNLLVRNGGSLTLENCILEMNKEAKNKHIYVDKGSTLNIKNTEVNLNETGYWYKIVEGGKVEIDCNLDIYGTLNVEGSVLKNSLGIKVHEGSKAHIHDSRILNCYHISYEGESDSKITRSHISTFIGIPIYCKSSSPVVRDSVLNVEYAGVGIYCLGSSPSVYNSEILVCEDEDSDSSALILVADSHPVLSNTRFNTKRVKRDKTSAIVFE